MVRTATFVLSLGLLLLIAGCGAGARPELEPAAPADNAPAGDARTPAATEPVEFAPASPALVDMSDAGSSSQAGEEQEMESEGIEAPAPGGRQPSARLAEEARQALAARLGVAVDDVTLESMELVTWADASLGCPEPEIMYAQVLTPGYRLVFTAGGEAYTYHTDRSARLVLCGARGAPVP